MSNRKKLVIVKISLILGVLPLIVHAYEYGPDPRRTGAPGDAGTCLDSGCHSGTLNSTAGSVKIILPNGNTYTPGVKQHIMVQITDAAKQKFGFELTARLASNLANGQAGDFTTTDGFTQVLCDDASNKVNGSPCSAKFPVQFIEHTMAGYTASTNGGYTYQFDWTPPATNVGNVTMYVAANSGPGGAPVSTGANIFTTNVTLTPAAAATGPTVDPGGIVPVYSTSTTIQPGSWISIYSFKAQNLATGLTQWNGDFPTTLGGVTVTINGKKAYLWFVSPAQINLQAPDDAATGSVPVVVTNAAGSTTTTVTLGTAGPSFLLLSDVKHATGYIFRSDGKGTVAGGAYDLVGPTSIAPARPVNRGEILIMYGVGFGPTNPAIPAGQVFIPTAANPPAQLITKPQITLGGVAVQVDSATLVGAGLYQFIFTVPQGVGSGDQAFVATVNGVQTPANVFIPVQ